MKFPHSHPVLILSALSMAAAVCLLPGCRSVERFPGQWLDIGTTRPDDFSRQITSHLYENGMMVGVGNDSRWLYIFFTPDIRHRQRPPSRVQLTLWLDEGGGKAKRLGLVHVSGPAGQTAPRPEGRQPGDGGDPGEPGVRPRPTAAGTAPALLKVIVPGQGKEFLVASDGSQGPAVRLAPDWGDFAYQWRIPFRGTGDWPGLKGEPGRVVGIGLHWRCEALAPAARKEDPRRSGGPEGGRPGMGPPPGMGPGGGMPGESLPSKRSLWLRTTLVRG